tara:strand:- start:7296 stop:9317 length:2022 start_codon:yes stop_codon:yes gene_type:complete
MSKKIVMVPVFCESHLVKYQIPNIIDTIDPDIIVYNEGMMPAGPESHGLLDDFRKKYTIDGKRGFDYGELKFIIKKAQEKYPDVQIILNEMDYPDDMADASTCYTKACTNFEELGIDVQPGDYLFPYEGDTFHHENSKQEIQGYLEQIQPDQGFTSVWIDFISNQHYAFKSTLKPFLLEEPEWADQARARRICIRFGTMDFYINELMNFQKQSYPNLFPTDLITYHYAWWRPGKYFDLRCEQLTNSLRPQPDFWKNFKKAYDKIDELKYNEIRVYPGPKHLTGKWVKYWDIEHPKHIKEHPNYIDKPVQNGINTNTIDIYEGTKNEIKKLHILGIDNWCDEKTGLSMFDERHKTAQYENDCCRNSGVVEQTHNIDEADIIWFRYKPEAISNYNIDDFKQTLETHKDKIILNHIDNFKNYDSKDRCYKIWKDNGFNVPDCVVVESFEDVKQMLNKHKKICLRSNNEAGGNYLNIVDDTMEESVIKNIYDELIKARDRQIAGTDHREHLNGYARGPRLDTKIIAVEFLKLPKMKHLHRVIVVGNEIVGGYSIGAPDDNIHLKNQTYENIDEFMKANMRLGALCNNEKFRKDMSKAVSCLGIHIGAIEFFEIDGKCYLVELNSTWAGSGGFTFWDDRIKPYMLENKEKFREKAWPIYEWNELGQYDRFYKAFSQFK